MSNDKDGLDGLGEQLKRILGDALPPGVNIEGVKVMGVPAGALKGPMRLRPAKLADLQGLLEGTHQKKFEIGDIVTLRPWAHRSEEHTSELQSLMRISYAVFCLKKKTQNTQKLQ